MEEGLDMLTIELSDEHKIIITIPKEKNYTIEQDDEGTITIKQK